MFTTALTHKYQHQARPTHKTRVGMCQGGDEVLQTSCDEFDSHPIQFNSAGIKPWGRRPVLEAGSGRFESFIPEVFLCIVAKR